MWKPIGPALQHQGRVHGALFSRDENRILTWSTDDTARVSLLNADLDFPAEHFELWIQAVTGTEYDFVTRHLIRETTRKSPPTTPNLVSIVPPTSGSAYGTNLVIKNTCELRIGLGERSPAYRPSCEN